MHEQISLKNTSEVIRGMRDQSEIMILDFAALSQTLPEYKNIKLFFEHSKKDGINPKNPEQRQHFNNLFLKLSGKKVLIGRYGEDRSAMLEGSLIAREGRTIHLGIDLFTADLEEVFCPFAGEVVQAGYETAPHGYGYWVIIEHLIGKTKFYSFYGHLGKRLLAKKIMRAGDIIGQIGDFKDGENGGWSRHLHFQLLNELPKEGITPLGYASPVQFEKYHVEVPNPNLVLQLPLISS